MAVLVLVIWSCQMGQVSSVASHFSVEHTVPVLLDYQDLLRIIARRAKGDAG